MEFDQDIIERREPRLPISSIILPFLGIRVEDEQCFEYLLQDVSKSGIKIAIPNWLQGRERLYIGQRVHFHVPFDLDGRILHSGTIAWERFDPEIDGQLIGAAMDEGAPPSYPILIKIQTGEVDIDLRQYRSKIGLVKSMAKDAMLLKRGILIYLHHLAAYCSRLVEISPEEYEAFRTIIFDDIIAKVGANAAVLKDFYEQVQNASDVAAVYSFTMHLDEVRQAIEPEIYVEIFKGIFEKSFAMRYILAIKQLEMKILTSYNAMVIIACASF